jgi:hypothetical protein
MGKFAGCDGSISIDDFQPKAANTKPHRQLVPRNSGSPADGDLILGTKSRRTGRSYATIAIDLTIARDISGSRLTIPGVWGSF